MAGRRMTAQLIMDTANASRALSAFGQDVRAISRQVDILEGATKTIGLQSFGFNQSNMGNTRAQIQTLSNQYVALGDTIRTTSRLQAQFISDWNTNPDGSKTPIYSTIFGAESTRYAGNFDRIVKAQENLSRILERQTDYERQKAQYLQQYAATADSLRATSTTTIDRLATNRDSARTSISTAQGRIATVDTARQAADQSVVVAQQKLQQAILREAQARIAYATGTGSQANLIRSQNAIVERQTKLAQAQAQQASVYSGTQRELTNANKQLAQATQREIAASQALTAERNGLRSRLAANTRASNRAIAGIPQPTQAEISQAEAALIAARTATPNLPNTISYLNQASPALLRKLEAEGLGQSKNFVRGGPTITPTSDAQQYVRNLMDQGAYENINIQKDLVRQVTRVSGAFTDAKGIVQNFSAEIDKNGKVLTRFGSNLSGVGNFLSQISRDFQKVLEFFIATTVIFGSFRFAIEEFGKIVEIDKSLRQLSITANSTKEETQDLFNGLADAAIRTATPLGEMVKAADDIALATRKAGQSTEVWRQNIISLSESVGILTNLAGIDTVKATDLLVSTMKQLGIEANGLPTVLNKVTAVAGGQSAAIADVITGLGAMAEASQQANLSLDETIATVQSLSQATSKTPAEVATAFKNLVGALGGPASKKALASYNIELKDADGNLRNILDIYREIQQKINDGIIPQSNVQALVRAIAGGPRRASDAAALLAIIDDIEEALQRSAAATNDAFLANAKVLDTLQAKLVQVQAQFDKFAVSKFASVIQDLGSNVVDILGGLLQILEILPSDTIVAIAQLAGMAAAFKLILVVGRGLIGMLVSTSTEFKAMTVDIVNATRALLGYKAAATTPAPVATGPGTVIPLGPGGNLSGRFGGLKNLAKAGPAAAIGAVSTGIGLASGQDFLPALGTGLQSAGITLALAAPIPHAKALGVVLALVGTGLSLVTGKAEENKGALEGDTEAVINAYLAYKEATLTLDNLTEKQDELNATMKRIQGIPAAEQTYDDLALLASTQQQYAEVALQLADANNALNTSYTELSKTLKGFPTYQIDAARSGLLNDQELQRLIKDLSIKLIQQTNPDFKPAGEFNLPGPVQTSPNIPFTGSTTATFTELAPSTTSGRGAPVLREVTFDLQELATNASLVNKLFTDTGEIIGGAFTPTVQNIQLIRDALVSMKDSIDPERYSRMATALDEFAGTVSPLTQLSTIIRDYNAYIDALQIADPFVKPEDLERARAMLAVYQTLASLSLGADPTGTRLSGRDSDPNYERRQQERAAALQRLNELTFNEDNTLRMEPKTIDEWKEYAELLFIINGEYDKAADKELVFKTAGQMAKNAKQEVEGLTDQISTFGEEAVEAIEKAKTAFQDFINEGIAKYAEESAQLNSDLASGNIKQGEFNTRIKEVNAFIDALRSIKDEYDALAETEPNIESIPFADVSSEAKQLAQQLEVIAGLQDAGSLTTQQLIERMLNLGEVYNLSGRQVDKLGKKLESLFKAIDTINKVKAQFRVDGVANVSQVLKALYALRNIANIFPGFAGTSQSSYINSAIAQLEAVQKASQTISNAGASFKNIYAGGNGSGSSGSGGGGSGGSGSRPGKDLSTLDLPEEIANAVNRDALIKEAIRRARSLQNKLPGENKEARNDIVELLKGTQRILEVRGVKDDYLRKALEELAAIEKKRLEFETKADIIRRIRVGAGDFAAIANVPINSRTGVSLAGPDGPINVTLNLNGSVLTPAQFEQFANMIAAALKRQLSR